jgi:DAACS family dicarboxylate/amino acid:cation (Na+ or H+) symporter
MENQRHGWPLHTKILLGLLIGATLGIAANVYAQRVPAAQETVQTIATQLADPVGRLFLRLVVMVVVPLVFSALALGVQELSDVHSLGRIGLRTLGLTVLLSLCSVAIGLTCVNLLRPGERLTAEQREMLNERYSAEATGHTAKAEARRPLAEVLLNLFPENPLQEAVGAVDGSSKGNGMLAVMVFALVTGIALAVTTQRTQVLVQWLEGIFDVCMTIIRFAMRLAPFCVACLLFSVTARIGWDILITLIGFVATVLLGLGLQMFVVYPITLLLFARMSPSKFFSAIREAIWTAFATSSSNATLPTSLRVARDSLGLRPEISQFVLTVGATGNQNGTALFEGVVVLFLAQVFGVHLDLVQQFHVVLMAVFAGVGTAGVPGGAIPLIVIVLHSVGVPGEGIAIVLGVDRLLDMCRTVLNVTGDLVLATVASNSEAVVSQPMAK